MHIIYDITKDFQRIWEKVVGSYTNIAFTIYFNKFTEWIHTYCAGTFGDIAKMNDST